MPTIAIVGDLFLQQTLPDTPALAEVGAALRSADVAFGNLEAPVSRRGVKSDKWINMRMSPDLLDDIQRLGFNLLTLANNHLFDFDETAFFDTLRYLDDSDLRYVGAGADLDAAWQAQIIDLAGTRVAFLGGCSTLGPGSAATSDRPGVAPVRVAESYHIDPAASLEQPGSAPYVHTRAWKDDLQRACQAVADAKASADFVIVAMHWGVPPTWRSRFQDGLAEYQIEVGHALVEAGADLIVGAHPHSLQEVEIWQGKPIFYSLGNFVFHHSRGARESPVSRHAPYTLNIKRRDRIWSETIILLAEITAGTVHCKLLPALLDENGNPHLLGGDEAQAVLERLALLSPQAALHYQDGVGYLVQGGARGENQSAT
ncbi:MAG: CapA family protein [Chloroflexi bacterium]|nr:CapA family protein [Chloroflexota bacterium]